MRALVVRKLGNPVPGPTEKCPYSVDDNHPTPQVLPPNAVRIKVAAAGLNFADALQVQGQYQVKPPLPFVPGAELSGTIVQTGRDVRTVAVGDKVIAVTQGGAFASEAVVRETAVIKMPQGADLVDAAGLPVAFGTAHLALKVRADVQPGQTVLVLGAGGGVGVAAVQIAKVLGAKVIAVVRGSQKADLVKQLGADTVIDTSTVQQQASAAGPSSKQAPRGRAQQQPDPVEEGYGALGGPPAQPTLRTHIKAVAPKGVDVIFDPVGGAAFSESLKVAAWDCQVVIIGFASGSIPKIPANIALVKNLTIHGIFWASYQAHMPRVFRHTLEETAAWLAQGKIRVHVSHRYPLQHASQAFNTMLTRQVIGKVLLLPDADGVSRM